MVTETVEATVLGGLWALYWSGDIRVTNLRCVKTKLRNLNVKSQLPSSYSFRGYSVYTNGRRDGYHCCWHGYIYSSSYPDKKIYTLWGQKRFLLPI